MHHHTTHIRKPAAALLALVLTGLLLAACGGTSKSSPATAPTASTAAAKSPTPLPSAAQASASYEALRACLARNGIHVPKSSSGKGTTGQRFGIPPPGVSAARYEAALQKCGFGGRVGVPGQVGSQAIRTSLQRYATCMRAQGFAIPQPGVAGSSATTGKIDTQSAKFKAAATKCSAGAREALGAAPGAR
jgi:hypothetical protein